MIGRLHEAWQRLGTGVRLLAAGVFALVFVRGVILGLGAGGLSLQGLVLAGIVIGALGLCACRARRCRSATPQAGQAH